MNSLIELVTSSFVMVVGWLVLRLPSTKEAVNRIGKKWFGWIIGSVPGEAARNISHGVG